MRRKDFIRLLGSAAATWPLAARAQQTALPVVAVVNSGSSEAGAPLVAQLHKGLSESGYVEGRNVMVEYHWLEGQYDQLPSITADIVRRRVNVIAPLGSVPAAQAAKAATTTIPIVFYVAEDPVKLGLVASIARPGGNATGVNALTVEVTAKRLGLLHELLPKAARIAVLANPGVASTEESTLRGTRQAARALGLQVQVFEAGSSREIELAFASLVRERADALFVAANAFFTSRRVQLTTLATRHAIPAIYPSRYYVEAGGLISYGPDNSDMVRRAGVYIGRILKGEMPADLPVIQETKFEFAINLTTARALGIEVPPALLATADVVIE
jgi:putative ABC transport system substrate-binding protein